MIDNDNEYIYKANIRKKIPANALSADSAKEKQFESVHEKCLARCQSRYLSEAQVTDCSA